MDNMVLKFNLLIYKGCYGNTGQIVRQMVYTLR